MFFKTRFYQGQCQHLCTLKQARFPVGHLLLGLQLGCNNMPESGYRGECTGIAICHGKHLWAPLLPLEAPP